MIELSLASGEVVAVKAWYSRVLCVTLSAYTGQPFSNVAAIKPNEFNVLDMAVSNAIRFNPIWSEIALER